MDERSSLTKQHDLEHLPIQRALWGNTDVLLGRLLPRAVTLFEVLAESESSEMTEEFRRRQHLEEDL